VRHQEAGGRPRSRSPGTAPAARSAAADVHARQLPVGQAFSAINGLTQVASAPASVEIGGGSGEVYFASISTSTTSFLLHLVSRHLYTLGNGHVIWNHAVLTQTGTGGAGHTVTVTGDATCGT